ncbi:hypothetical protein [Nesterenkonia sp.]|uniref:hypothetical protein n=1 Tax=Nesterenkonia sp. TaxID=704201 RepID=UPI00260EF9C1|nr:hypothetical protein [Nesterenkonia sp.]
MVTIKRPIETILVALPVLLLICGVATGTFDMAPAVVLHAAVIAGLAVWVWTQHWGAYLGLLAVGVACLFVQGLIALAFWATGGLYVTIAVINLVVTLVRTRRGDRPAHS